MLDFVLLAKAALAAAGVAALLTCVVRRLVKIPQSWRASAGCILAAGAGIYAGCAVLGQWPRWNMAEDRDRFLVILLPLTLAVELSATRLQSQRSAWLLRSLVSAVAAPTLLYNSVYLADLTGSNSAEWSAGQATGILLLLAAMLFVSWRLLALLESRSSPPLVSAVMVLAILASGVTVMHTGYYKAGLLSLPLAGAVAGVMLASAGAAKSASSTGCLGVAMIGLFTLVLIGRFYGALPTHLALCLLFSPLLAWIAELPFLVRLRPWPKAAAQIALVAVPLMFVVADARMQYTKAYHSRSRAAGMGTNIDGRDQPTTGQSR